MPDDGYRDPHEFMDTAMMDRTMRFTPGSRNVGGHRQ
jgi:hypothetical protein